MTGPSTGRVARAAADADLERLERRLGAVRAGMAAVGHERLLVSDRANVRWLTGFAGSAGSVYVPLEGEVVLVTDDRYALRAAAEAPGVRILLDRTLSWLPDHHPEGAPLAVEADHLTWQQVQEVQAILQPGEVVASSGIVAGQRATKDDDELSLLRRACAVTAKALEDALGWLRPGLSEREVALRLERTMVDMGAEGLAFDSIIASGPNGAVPHHRPGDRVLRVGDVVTMDFGARVDGYHADMTRNVALGRPDPALLRLHGLVRAAQQAGVEAVRAGVATTAVDRAAREVIAEAGHGGDFRHGTGHGVGLEVHERPFIGETTPGTLQPRMTVTVEPGVYLSGLGGVRIEDVVLVGVADAERLTTAAHDLIIL